MRTLCTFRAKYYQYLAEPSTTAQSLSGVAVDPAVYCVQITLFLLHMMEGGMCSCPHHKVTPLLIVLIGVAFLLQALNVLDAATVGMIWPIGLILIGLMKMSGGMCGCCGMMKKK